MTLPRPTRAEQERIERLAGHPAIRGSAMVLGLFVFGIGLEMLLGPSLATQVELATGAAIAVVIGRSAIAIWKLSRGRPDAFRIPPP